MSILSGFSNVSALCVGDVMLDRFVGGTVRRISPESPVPVLSVADQQVFAGGAANVARNIGVLGGHCTLIGVVGGDSVAEELRRLLATTHNVDPVFVGVEGRRTTEKIRFVAHGQHMLRADSEDNAPIQPEAEERLIAEIAARISGHHVLILSDYAKGVLTPRVVVEAIALARRAGVAVIVDPKSNQLARYNNATLVTPNLQETFAATGIDPCDDDAAAAAGKTILAQTTIEA